MIITIGRECGCAGDRIGRKLAEKYGIPCYTKKNLIELAKEKDIYETYPMYFGEMPVDAMMNPMDEEFRERLRHTPYNALVQLIGESDCVVVGRASNYAFRSREDAVRIFLCGDPEKRIAKIARKHDMTRRKAEKIVEQTDNRRRGYHAYYTGEEWGAAPNYDLCLNESKLGVEGVIKMTEVYIDSVLPSPFNA